MRACDRCLRRSWLLGALAGALELAWKDKTPLRDVLSLPDEELIAALLPPDREERARAARSAFDPAAARERIAATRLHAVCRHDGGYPARLLESEDAPAVLHLAGDPERLASLVGGEAPAVALVGTRRASPDGLEAARQLGRGLAASGVTVVSGMALGVDAAAHSGALEVGGPTVAVLASGADRPTPKSKAPLHRELVASQLVVSELPPGFEPFRWCFPARNRIIAGLAQMTVVVEGAERSGSLITADFATALGREVGAVPGRAASTRTRGSNGLLRDGATVVLDAGDVLDVLLGSDRPALLPPVRRSVRPELEALLDRVSAGEDRVDLLGDTPEAAEDARRGLVELELAGLVRRVDGGRFIPCG